MFDGVKTLGNHPLANLHLTAMRDTETGMASFRYHLSALSALLAAEASRLLEYRDVEVRTPLALAAGKQINGAVFLVPILRAALGMMPAFEQLLPFAQTAHLGLKRDEETHEALCYYRNFPGAFRCAQALVLDPMLATGGSAAAAIDAIRAEGGLVKAFVCCLAAPEGVQALAKAHPDVPILAGCVDEKLNEKAYIVPGLGDAGDRCFGT